MEKNHGESARPPIVRFNIGDEDIGFISENRKHDAVLNAATERSSAVSFQILQPKQAEVRTPVKCHNLQRF